MLSQGFYIRGGLKMAVLSQHFGEMHLDICAIKKKDDLEDTDEDEDMDKEEDIEDDMDLDDEDEDKDDSDGDDDTGVDPDEMDDGGEY